MFRPMRQHKDCPQKIAVVGDAAAMHIKKLRNGAYVEQAMDWRVAFQNYRGKRIT